MQPVPSSEEFTSIRMQRIMCVDPYLSPNLVPQDSINCTKLLARMRVGALHGGLEHVDQNAIPPAQKLRVTEQFTAARPSPHESE